MTAQIEVTPFSEHTIAQAITLLRSFCRVRNKVPYTVALVEGSVLERDAWRKVAIDYLTAKATGRKVNAAGEKVEQAKAEDFEFEDDE